MPVRVNHWKCMYLCYWEDMTGFSTSLGHGYKTYRPRARFRLWSSIIQPSVLLLVLDQPCAPYAVCAGLAAHRMQWAELVWFALHTVPTRGCAQLHMCCMQCAGLVRGACCKWCTVLVWSMCCRWYSGRMGPYVLDSELVQIGPTDQPTHWSQCAELVQSSQSWSKLGANTSYRWIV